MRDAMVAEGIRRKFDALEPVLDERSRRQWAGAEAMAVGWGGVSVVALATGMSRTTKRGTTKRGTTERGHPLFFDRPSAVDSAHATQAPSLRRRDRLPRDEPGQRTPHDLPQG